MTDYLKVSEMAKVAQLNPRTLHYYDEIGLFSPYIKAENGYRYYARHQLADLGMILSLKALDMPLKEIKSVLTSDSQRTTELLEKQQSLIDQKIDQLVAMKEVIDRRLNRLDQAQQPLMTVTLVEKNEEYLLVSDQVLTQSDDDLVSRAYDLLMEEGQYLFTNHDYGFMVNQGQVITTNCDYFYMKTTHKEKAHLIKPAGQYLQIISQGGDDCVKEAYRLLLDYSQHHQLTLDGYFYERILHETTLENVADYVTEIQIKLVEEEQR